MNLDRLLLETALRHRIDVPDQEEGCLRFAEIAGHAVNPAEFAAALGRLLAAGLIHEPVRIEDGALQCHWVLEPTPAGVAKLRGN